jgi:hypothetical protein
VCNPSNRDCTTPNNPVEAYTVPSYPASRV